MSVLLLNRFENITAKFQKSSAAEASECNCMWERVKYFPDAHEF